jgi:SSS family solute:Na+ symporter
VGLVLAGLVAAIMSSIDSTLNSASTLVTLDFVQVRNPNLTGEEIARVGRVVMGVVMVLSALWAPQIASFEGLFAYLQEVLAYIVPPVAALFLLGLFWPRATAPAAFWALLGSHVASLVVFAGQKSGALPPVHFTIVAGLLFALTSALVVTISLLTPAPPAEKARAFAAEAEATYRGPPWADPRALSAGVLACTAALVLAFW